MTKKDKGIDPKLIKIRESLETRGFDLECDENGIRLMLDQNGFQNGVLDIYTLKKNRNEIRARFRKKAENVTPEHEDAEQFAGHGGTDPKYIQSRLRAGLEGIVRVGAFHYFGFKNDAHYYYSRLVMEEEPSEAFQRKIFAQNALAHLKGVDSKIFRQGLDTLGLPRSSIVRLALTRIFRGASDPDELLEVASREARRIVNAEEWKTIKELIKETRVPFMSNIIYILWDEVSRFYMEKAWRSLHN